MTENLKDSSNLDLHERMMLRRVPQVEIAVSTLSLKVEGRGM